ncbi:MAG: hypothetical protein HC836_25605 [Richelia sp. RM2_1_2]|nr:hypothetical protein [Richelia sp. RM2_1_2]
MADIIILSDQSDWYGSNCCRYIGPYVVASQLEEVGYDVAVIDWFTRMPNFFQFLEELLSKKTVMVCISTTFLSAMQQSSNDDTRTDMSARHYNTAITYWHKNVNELSNWLAELRNVLNTYNTKCKIVLGGTKTEFLYNASDNPYFKNIFQEN